MNAWNDDSPANINKQWLPMVSKWCLSIHSSNWNSLGSSRLCGSHCSTLRVARRIPRRTSRPRFVLQEALETLRLRRLRMPTQGRCRQPCVGVLLLAAMDESSNGCWRCKSWDDSPSITAESENHMAREEGYILIWL